PYLPSCIFSEPQWWHQSRFPGVASEEAFATMGGYCRQMTNDPRLLRTCFEGMGAIAAPNAKNVPEKAAALCDAAASSSALQSLFCKSYAANAIGLDENTTVGIRVCSGLSKDAYAYCKAYAQN